MAEDWGAGEAHITTRGNIQIREFQPKDIINVLMEVNQCWTQKAPLISAQVMPAAVKAYDHARDVYREVIKESTDKE